MVTKEEELAKEKERAEAYRAAYLYEHKKLREITNKLWEIQNIIDKE